MENFKKKLENMENFKTISEMEGMIFVAEVILFSTVITVPVMPKEKTLSGVYID